MLAAIVLGVGLPGLDARIDSRLPSNVAGYLFTGGPEAARTVLSVVAGSLITVTSLIFSLTVLTLQLASSLYSPRLLRTFTGDRLVQLTLALLLATFTYSVTVLRTIRASVGEISAFVPQISVTTAYVLQLASVVMLVVFLAHLARQLRVESLMRSVHSETTETIRQVLDVKSADGFLTVPETGLAVLCVRSSGFLLSVQSKKLLAAAVEADAVVVLDRVPGDSLIAGTPIAFAWACGRHRPLPKEAVARLEDRMNAAVQTGFERTLAQDFVFGLRQLIDVAVKALSPGINDPTTAVHALGHTSALMCDLMDRDLTPCLLRDDEGQDRVMLRRPSLSMLLELVVTEPRHFAASVPEVLARLFMMLREMAWRARRPEYLRAIGAELGRLRATVERQDFDRVERERLDSLATSVEEALTGRWAPARPS
ncbi:DUF2254 domain-containing protein [Microbispora sp. RL4-1S]|uniref:DUF2254 domain-containing protein n=1 Tax=Microbispora oryzae TaxID=2806554 RepID=A0A941AJ53_9ACTN|nr:DUF2254 domain-containing protein [Microbispora oryzae]